MPIEVENYIADLLFENKSISIPGLGSIISEYKEAKIDPIQGKISPPAKELKFNKNMVLNDGVLVNRIKESTGLSLSEAKNLVNDYVEQVKMALDRKEIVVIPKIGKLYKDYDDNFQFLPEQTNFNVESYGLPDVEFRPIVRTQEEVKQSGVAAAVKDPSVPTQEEKINSSVANWFQKNLALIASLTAILIIIAIITMVYDLNPSTEAASNEAENATSPRINESPSRNAAENENTAGFDSLDADEQISMIEEEEDVSPVEEPTIMNQRTCVIVIGLFGDPQNVQRLVERIYKAGYEPYTEKKGKLTRVGVQFAYEESSEIDKKLADVRTKFEKGAVVFKK
ncbi:MAG: HU family DNA-binding protein [Bacteroidota bacterium]